MISHLVQSWMLELCSYLRIRRTKLISRFLNFCHDEAGSVSVATSNACLKHIFVIQQVHFWVFTRRKWKHSFEKRYAHLCSLQHYLQYQPKCPSTDEWIKMCFIYIYTHTHIHTMEYYSARKRNEPANCHENGSRRYYAKWNVTQGKTNTIWFHLYVES